MTCFCIFFFFFFFFAVCSYQACRIGKHVIFFFLFYSFIYFLFFNSTILLLYSFYYTFLFVSTTTTIMAAIVVWQDAVCCISFCSVLFVLLGFICFNFCMQCESCIEFPPFYKILSYSHVIAYSFVL